MEHVNDNDVNTANNISWRHNWTRATGKCRLPVLRSDRTDMMMMMMMTTTTTTMMTTTTMTMTMTMMMMMEHFKLGKVKYPNNN
jgi:hypothetical protein